ncbi:MAG: biotin--[acetyl-CoA-carboxylase] ligase [Ruminiclostridium sp.]|nr:biotin--[acetyl-CoA-carboxylase] ligase [Ruminiclostridium sp.]
MQGGDKKYEILRILKEKYPEFVSGEELSRYLKISRTAVWKYIKSLKADGYILEASSKIGYKLVESCIFNGYEIACDLGTDIIGKKILYLKSVDSTNNYGKKIASEGAEEGLAIVAGSQSNGRGRLGRKWDSPSDAGLYLSVILRPELPPEEIQGITLAASVAVAHVIEKITGIKPGIKWPNDVLLDDRKVCGILTEMNSEIDRVNFIVLGIGINYNRRQDEFPAEFAGKATSLIAYAGEHGIGMKVPGRLVLIRSVLQELDIVYSMILNNRTKEILDKWREYSVILGREVRIISCTTEYTAAAEDITADGKLIVRCSDGNLKLIQSGEVMLRGVSGYV